MGDEPRRDLIRELRSRLPDDPTRLLLYAALAAALGVWFGLLSVYDLMPFPLVQAAYLVLLMLTAAMAARVLSSALPAPAVRAPAAVLLIVGEGAAILGLAVAARESGAGPGPLAAGFLALAGVLALSFARVRIRASAGADLPDGPLGLASREVRLVVLALGVILGAEYAALIIVAAACHATVFLHLLTMRRSLAG